MYLNIFWFVQRGKGSVALWSLCAWPWLFLRADLDSYSCGFENICFRRETGGGVTTRLRSTFDWVNGLWRTFPGRRSIRGIFVSNVLSGINNNMHELLSCRFCDLRLHVSVVFSLSYQLSLFTGHLSMQSSQWTQRTFNELSMNNAHINCHCTLGISQCKTLNDLDELSMDSMSSRWTRWALNELDELSMNSMPI